MKNLANYFTFLRIFLAPLIFIFIINEKTQLLALIIFIFASFTDFLDGYFARKSGNVSVLGEVLDPIADKILIIFILFALATHLSSYFIGIFGGLILARELWIGALRDYCARNFFQEKTKVTFLAKIKTTVQMSTIGTYILGLAINQNLLLVVGDISLVAATAITLYTGYQYTLNVFE